MIGDGASQGGCALDAVESVAREGGRRGIAGAPLAGAPSRGEVTGVAQGAGQTGWTVPTLAAGNYWWRAWAGDGANRTDLTAAEAFTVSSYTSGVDLGAALSLRVLGSDRLRLTLPARADVTVDIHDARGARVQRVFSGSLEAGERALSWDGRDTQGRTVASGVYFVRALVGGEQLVGRLVVVR